MNDKQIGKALLNLDNASLGSGRSPAEIAQHVFKRDRLRLRLLAGISTFLWMLTVAGVIWLIVFYFMFVVPRLDAYAAGRLQLDNDWKEWKRAFDAGAEILLTSIISFLLAALGTVTLVLAARRATLRQIQADLAHIAEQLRTLQGAQHNSGE